MGRAWRKKGLMSRRLNALKTLETVKEPNKIQLQEIEILKEQVCSTIAMCLPICAPFTTTTSTFGIQCGSVCANGLPPSKKAPIFNESQFRFWL